MSIGDYLSLTLIVVLTVRFLQDWYVLSHTKPVENLRNRVKSLEDRLKDQGVVTGFTVHEDGTAAAVTAPLVPSEKR